MDPRTPTRAPTTDSQPAACACDVSRIRAHFDDKARRSDAAPLHATTRGLLDLLGDAHGRTVLELGSGRGGFLLAVLRAGAARVTGIDLSPASIAAARRRLSEAGFSERATLLEGDGAVVDIDPHDWIVLDRVICCYPNPKALVSNSARAARSRYALSAPASRGLRGLLARVFWRVDNLLDSVRGQACRGFVHDLDEIEATLSVLGFERRAQAYRGLWYLAVFEPTERDLHPPAR